MFVWFVNQHLHRWQTSCLAKSVKALELKNPLIMRSDLLGISFEAPDICSLVSVNYGAIFQIYLNSVPLFWAMSFVKVIFM